MPGPGIYVVAGVAVVVGVAAGIAFKEFVYDPHLAPKIEQWTGAYATYLTARRRKRAMSHSYSHLHSDDEGEDHGKSSMELEGLVEREMHMLGQETILRQRKRPAPDATGLEMMEKSNPFIPFAPLSPSPVSSPSKVPLTREEDAMPIGRLPTSPAEQRIPSQTSAPSSRSLASVPSPVQSPNPQNLLVPSSTPQESLGSHVISPLTSEYDFAAASRGTSPFTSASVSRAGTPWTDARSGSDAWSTDLQSRASLSDNSSETSSVADIEHPHLDASLYHTAVYSPSLNNHSEISLDDQSIVSSDTSVSSSVDTRSDPSLDFLGSEGADPVDVRSPISAPNILSDDEWDHMSEAGRSMHQ